MRKLIYLVLFVFVLMSCSLDSRNTEKSIDLVEKYIKSVEEMDYEAMADLLDENYIGLGPSYTDSIGKEQALASWKYNVENLYESIEYSRVQNAPVIIKDGYNKGEWVSSWAELKIRYKDKAAVVIWANTVYKVENEKIIKSLTFYNEADVLRQLGYVSIHSNDL